MTAKSIWSMIYGDGKKNKVIKVYSRKNSKVFCIEENLADIFNILFWLDNKYGYTNQLQKWTTPFIS